MKQFFESKIFQAVSIFSTLLLHNILWFICSLPIVTIGSATTAMYRIAFNVREERTTSIGAFFEAFRENFKKATISWGVLIAVSFAAVFYINSLLTFSSLLVQRVMLAVLLIVVVPIAIAGTYVFPLFSYYDNSIFQTWKNALTIGILRAPQTIIIMILQISPFLVAYAWPEWFIRLGILWVLLGPSLIMYCNSALFLKVFQSVQEV